VPILLANLQHEELTSQILVFFHANTIVLGLDMLEILCSFIGTCASQLPFQRSLDLLRILMLAIEQYKL